MIEKNEFLRRTKVKKKSSLWLVWAFHVMKIYERAMHITRWSTIQIYDPIWIFSWKSTHFGVCFYFTWKVGDVLSILCTSVSCATGNEIFLKGNIFFLVNCLLSLCTSGMKATILDVLQIDMAPTLSLLLGHPIPQNSLGCAIPQVLNGSLAMREQLRALQLNGYQLMAVHQKNAGKSDEGEDRNRNKGGFYKSVQV